VKVKGPLSAWPPPMGCWGVGWGSMYDTGGIASGGVEVGATGTSNGEGEGPAVGERIGGDEVAGAGATGAHPFTKISAAAQAKQLPIGCFLRSTSVSPQGQDADVPLGPWTRLSRGLASDTRSP
jgi:hypothetical protein